MKKDKKGNDLGLYTVIPVVPFQLCPKCEGEGSVMVSKFDGTVYSNEAVSCPVCAGNMIIPMYNNSFGFIPN